MSGDLNSGMTHHDQLNDPSPRRHSVATVGLWVFMAALVVLFGASMFGYVWIRVFGPQPLSQKTQPIHVPWLLWVSTALVLGVSFTLHRAIASIRREHHDPFRTHLRLSLGLAVGFIAVQTPAMIMLLREHAAARASGLHIYGLIFFLVLLHALHVVGGIVALVRAILLESRGLFDHEHFLPVRHAAMYWHFLDIVWLVMFGTFLAVG